MDRLGYSEAIARKMLYGGGLSIYTTQDARIQAIVDGEINNPENYKAAYLSADYRLSIRHADGSMSHYSEQDIRKYHNEELKDNYNACMQMRKKYRPMWTVSKRSILRKGMR